MSPQRMMHIAIWVEMIATWGLLITIVHALAVGAYLAAAIIIGVAVCVQVIDSSMSRVDVEYTIRVDGAVSELIMRLIAFPAQAVQSICRHNKKVTIKIERA